MGWVGDSRAYWLPESGAPRLLTVDDSFAAEQIADGVPRADGRERTAGARDHPVAGLDAPDHTPRTVSLDLDGAGWLLVCSDGLWNYCSEAHELGGLVRAAPASPTEPLALAGALVDWANAQGGQDNITVALARVGAGPPDPTAGPPSPSPIVPAARPTREEVQPDGNILS